jgi:farnesol dehydrogenase
MSGKAPMIVPGLVRKFNHQWNVSSDKAKRDLGYEPRGVKEGIEDTLLWINKTKDHER